MGDVVLALMRTVSSLRSGRIWLYVAAPAVVSLLLWIFLALRGLGVMVDWLLGHQPMTLLIAWGVAWLGCSCCPSPALMTAQSTDLATKAAAPL